MSDVATLFFRFEYVLSAAQLAFAMVGMGATLTVGDFGKVLRVPRGVLVGLAVQLLLIPALALAVSWIFALEAGLAVGLLLVAAVPGGSMSNVFTYFARGNIALSIVLTAVTTLVCLVTTPLVLELLMGRHLPADVDMPEGRISFEIACFLLGPLALGMAAGAWRPEGRHAIARWGIRASVGCILLIAPPARSRRTASTRRGTARGRSSRCSRSRSSRCRRDSSRAASPVFRARTGSPSAPRRRSATPTWVW